MGFQRISNLSRCQLTDGLGLAGPRRRIRWAVRTGLPLGSTARRGVPFFFRHVLYARAKVRDLAAFSTQGKRILLAIDTPRRLDKRLSLGFGDGRFRIA